MKKILLFALTLSVFGAYAQNVVFNDLALKQKIALHDRNVVGGVTGPNISLIDTDLNGEISIAEAQAYTGRLYLNQNGANFYTDLTGLEEFINITELFCQNNQMTTLDVSANTSLTRLDCEYNQITSLNLVNNTDLEILNYSFNNLPNVNLAPLVNLVELVCDNANIVNLNLSANVNLQRVTCNDNLMTTLNVTNCVSLTDLNCYRNQLTTIDLLDNTNLEDLYCYENVITDLNLTNNISLRYFGISDNELTALVLSGNTDLRDLSCADNQIVELGLSNNLSLDGVYAPNNNLTSLILPNLIYDVNVNNNNLTSLDISTNLNIYGLNCGNNELTDLNVANANNANFYQMITTGNADLACVTVDDVQYSNDNWINVDATTSYSIDCPTMVTDITVTSQSGEYTIITDGGTLQMVADVLPLLATDATYTWSVTNGTGSAIIDANGLLTATNNGTVSAIATANDGSEIGGMVTVTISNQTMASVNGNDISISIYPNPTTGIVNFETNEQINRIEIYNLIGERVNVFSNVNSINIKDFNTGIYIVKVITDTDKIVTKKLVKK